MLAPCGGDSAAVVVGCAQVQANRVRPCLNVVCSTVARGGSSNFSSAVLTLRPALRIPMLGSKPSNMSHLDPLATINHG
jgi:hypothetical protein